MCAQQGSAEGHGCILLWAIPNLPTESGCRSGFFWYFTLKNVDEPRKCNHAEKREKRGLFCWHWPSERGPTEGSRAWLGSVPLGWLGNGLDASEEHAWKPSFHQQFKQESSDHGSLLFDHTLSLVQLFPKRNYPNHHVQSVLVNASVSQWRSSSGVPQGMELGLVGAG